MLISGNLHNKRSEVSIITRSPPAPLPFKGRATRHTTVKRSNTADGIFFAYLTRVRQNFSTQLILQGSCNFILLAGVSKELA